jgi:hypothetical protein
MKTAIAITLAFFAVVSAMGAYRDIGRLQRDRRASRYLGVVMAIGVTVWCGVAAWWEIQ